MMKSQIVTLIAALMILNSCGGGGGSSDAPANTDTSIQPNDNATNTPTDTTNNEGANDSQSTDDNNTQTTQDPNETTNPPETPTEGTSANDSTDTTNEESLLTPSDEPYYNYSWHIDSANSIESLADFTTINKDADIGVTKAWDITQGKSVKVAVIDDGFDVNHEDLKDNIAVVYSVDNDNNDVSNTNNTRALHGSSCAGFIVAPINGKGSMGIAPNAKLIGIKLLSQEDSDTIKAFEYAQSQGAKVISCSWGSEDVSQAVVAKLKELYDAGITVLFASGNDGKSLDAAAISDESEVEWVIGVGASGENNDVTLYSNYGKNIEVLAPGGDTDSLGLLGIDDSGEQGSTNQLDLVDNNYAFVDGTSFATPVTAGVVALMYAANPTITPAQVRTILTSTATKIGGDKANYIDGFDEKRAYGKINAYLAVSEAQKLK
ncbi:MAG: S8 family serine peptidase [Campylobacterales bacterium]|nr:S8 family serine peptidase [Campylobacterales bacterium]